MAVRVLVGAGDPVLNRALSELLSSTGYEVVAATTGTAALEEARHHAPAVALIDADLQDPDGYDTCHLLKQNGGTPYPVLLLSERRGREEILRGVRAGADDLIGKPVVKERILDRIRAALTGPRPGPVLPPSRWDRRGAPRAAVTWTVSWCAPAAEGYGVTFKNRVVDISVTGLALEFQRCSPCTGYEPGGVHPLCLLRPHAVAVAGSPELDLILCLTPEVVLEIKGRVAHIHQPTDWLHTEKVGIVFDAPPPEAAALISKWVAGELRF